jgi:hypothetical protein
LLTQIRPLSRRCLILTDSDRSAARRPLKHHVQRWKTELAGDSDAELFITWGREVENYLPIHVVNGIRSELSIKRLSSIESTYRFEQVLDESLRRRVKKVAFARRALLALDGQVPPNAQAHVKAIASFIRASATQ